MKLAIFLQERDFYATGVAQPGDAMFTAFSTMGWRRKAGISVDATGRSVKYLSLTARLSLRREPKSER